MAGHVFTDDEIQQIIDVINTTRHTQYIGQRYVPILGRKGEDSVEWDNAKPYEPLTVVLHAGNSYTSRQFVPAGADINDETYWAETGNYNAQVEQYRQDVVNLGTRVSRNETGVRENADAIGGLGRRVTTNETGIAANKAAADGATRRLELFGVTDDQTATDRGRQLDDTTTLAQTNASNIAVHGGRIDGIGNILDGLGATSVPAATSLANAIARTSRTLSHVYDIRDYGADTASEDNSPQIQAAVDAAYAAGGGTVFIPAGTWNVKRNTDTTWFGAKCAVKLFSNVSLIGESMETAILRPNDGNQNAAVISATQTLENSRIAYLRIEMSHLPASATIAEKGIYSQNLIDCMIDHIHVNGSNGTGIGVDLLQSCIIDHNVITHCGRGWMVGKHLGCSGIGIGAGTMSAPEHQLTEMSIVSNNFILDSGQFGIFYEHQGMNVETEQPTAFGGTRFAEVIICDNVLRNTTWKGIGIVALQGVQVHGNVIHGAQQDAIEVSKWTSDCSIRGNTAINCIRGITVGVDAQRDVSQGNHWTLDHIYVCDNDIRCASPGITINANISESRVSDNTVFCSTPGAVAYAVTGVDANNKITATKFFADGNVSPSRTVTRDVVWSDSPNSQNQFNSGS